MLLIFRDADGIKLQFAAFYSSKEFNYQLCVYVCPSVGLCICVQFSLMPEEGVGSSGAGVTGSGELSDIRSSTRAAGSSCEPTTGRSLQTPLFVLKS